MAAYPRLSFTAHQALHDDGSVELQNTEVERYKLVEYPDWRTAFHMVPDIFSVSEELRTPNQIKGDDGELKVYRRLRELGNELGEPMFVIHSFKFNEQVRRSGEVTRVYGETDFVIVSRKYGVIFMEVKAVETQWTLPGRFKKAQDQIYKVKTALADYLRDKVPNMPSCGGLFRNPGFAVVPNCPRPWSSMEPYKDGCFKEDCQDGSSFKAWWKKNIGCVDPLNLSEEVYMGLLCRFIGLRCTTRRTMGQLVDDTTQEVLQLFNKEQLALVSNFGLPCHLLITGPAGSGKTCILVHKVRALDIDIRKTGKREKILVVCYNKPLQTRLQKELEDCRWVTVRTFDSILYNLRPADSKHVVDMTDQEKCELINHILHYASRDQPEFSYEHVFADEGQDFIGNWRELLKELQARSPCDKKFHWIFFDGNQYLYNLATGFSAEELRNAIKLPKVYRMTGNVFNQFKKYYSDPKEKTECSIGHHIIGPCIEWDRIDRSEDHISSHVACDYISRHVFGLIADDVCRKDICVLLRSSKEADRIDDSLHAKGIKCQSAEDSITNPDNSAIIVDSIRRFKGLETKVLILYDPPYCVDREDKRHVRQLLYVALSRCFCLVIIIAPAAVVDSLQSELGMDVAQRQAHPGNRRYDGGHWGGGSANTRGNYSKRSRGMDSYNSPRLGWR